MIRLETENLYLDLVREEDAEFILELRNNPDLNKYISYTDVSLEKQKDWIKKYKEREKEEKEFYFIIRIKNTLLKCGTVRIYNITEENVTWGSFILNRERPDGASYEVIKETLKFIFNLLKINTVLLDVKKENYKAIHIYEKSGFKKFDEDKENFFYILKN